MFIGCLYYADTILDWTLVINFQFNFKLKIKTCRVISNYFFVTCWVIGLYVLGETDYKFSCSIQH